MSIDCGALYQFARVLHCLELPQLMQNALDTLGEITGARHGLLALLNDDYEVSAAVHLSTNEASLPWQALIELGLAGYVVHSQRTVVLHNLSRDPRWPRAEGLPRRGSAIGVPLKQGESIFGLLLLIHDSIDYFSQTRVETLEEAAALATDALRNALEHTDLRRQADLRDGLVLVPTVDGAAPFGPREDDIEQLRSDLTSMIYHDMRNPLQTIKLSLQKLTQLLANHDNIAVLTLLQTGTRGTRQLRRMIDSLLDVQRMEEGNTILNTRQTDLHIVLAEAVQLVQPLAQDAGLRVKFELAKDLPTLAMDEDMILRVVTNLLENAVKYTPDGGVITLRACVEHETAIISVEDNGPGIPEHLQQSIFEKFSRVQYKEAPNGIGLGLTFCRLAVHAHGGSIWVESTPDKGSTFIFTLPIVQQTEQEADGQDETRPYEAIKAVV